MEGIRHKNSAAAEAGVGEKQIVIDMKLAAEVREMETMPVASFVAESVRRMGSRCTEREVRKIVVDRNIAVE